MGDLVHISGAPPFPFGSIARHGRGKFVLYRGVDPLNLGSHEGQAYLLEMAPFDAGIVQSFAGPPWPFGSIPRRVPRHWTNTGQAVTIYPACTGNAARSTASDDVPADTVVPGKLSGLFNYEIALWSGSDPTSGGQATVGILELIDPDGGLDDLRTLGWDGAPVVLRRGDPQSYFSTFTVFARLSAAGLRSNLRRKEILLRDQAWALQQAELHGQRYLGTGGIEGPTELKGQIKPIGLGPVFNATPKLINVAKLIYQVSFTSILAVDAVKDGGSGLAADTDYPTYAALEAATVAAGDYATCLAQGLVRLGAIPVSVCTVDFRGDNDALAGGAYPHTRGQIVRRIACGRGAVRLSDPTDIDTASFEALETWQPATLGYYWDKEITKAAAIAEVMAGCAGWWTVRLDGKLAAGQIEDPALAVPDFSLSYPAEETTAEVRVDEPAMTDYKPPRRTTIMGWRRNYTPLEDNQILGAAQADTAILKAESSYVTAEDSWVAAAFPTSGVVTVQGGFTAEADAERECNRQSRLFRTVRETYDIPAVIDPFADVVARVVNVENGGRIGLGAARKLFIYGIAVNANAKPILRGWG